MNQHTREKWEILKEIRYKGRLNNFSLDEIVECIEEELAFDKRAEQLEKEWKRTMPTNAEIAEPFYAEGVNRDEMYERRRKYLLSDYENEFRNFVNGKITEKEKNRSLLNYRLHSYKPNDNDISEAEIEKARNRNIEDFIEVKKGFALCPFHHESTPSMSITGKLYYCFGCSRGGDVIKFIVELKNITFKQAIKFLCQ